ncbi:MAG: sigma-54-dependent Fis family transcriptional regulator [Rhodospirillales bacterium]|nr:sigma-54-dependent Fis family transcriptional regulator [Rhodospirillales bacterium]
MSEPTPFGDLKVLVVEDDDIVRVTLIDRLKAEGIPSAEAGNLAEAASILAGGAIDLVVSDIRLPDGSGKELFERISRHQPGLPVILMTAFASVADAVALVQAGAIDYIEKPFALDELVAKISRVLGAIQDARGDSGGEVRYRLGDGLMGRAPAIRRIERLIARLHANDSPVLIVGEAGLGKKVLARLVHHASRRADGPFVKINGSMGKDLIKELGGENGALRRAVSGTLYLDTLAGLPDDVQRVLLDLVRAPPQRGAGAGKPLHDIRIIAGSQERPEALLETGRLRSDLFWNLNIIRIEIPPLRDRPQDIVAFARQILNDLAQGGHRQLAGLSPEAELRLAGLDLPGNVRELRTLLERAVALCDGTRIEAHDLMPLADTDPDGDDDLLRTGRGEATLKDAVEGAEQTAIRQALIQNQGAMAKTAEALGISRKNLWEKMRRYGITP